MSDDLFGKGRTEISLVNGNHHESRASADQNPLPSTGGFAGTLGLLPVQILYGEVPVDKKLDRDLCRRIDTVLLKIRSPEKLSGESSPDISIVNR